MFLAASWVGWTESLHKFLALSSPSQRLLDLSKKRNFYLPHLHLAPLLWVAPFEFHQDLWCQKTSLFVFFTGSKRMHWVHIPVFNYSGRFWDFRFRQEMFYTNWDVGPTKLKILPSFIIWSPAGAHPLRNLLEIFRICEKFRELWSIKIWRDSLKRF